MVSSGSHQGGVKGKPVADSGREKVMFWPDRTMAQFVEPAGAVRIPAPLKRISPQETACI
jgi:hypothetical protein